MNEPRMTQDEIATCAQDVGIRMSTYFSEQKLSIWAMSKETADAYVATFVNDYAQRAGVFYDDEIVRMRETLDGWLCQG